MAVLAELTLPQTLGGTKVGVTFVADAKVGCTISELDDKQTASFTYDPSGDDGGSLIDGRIFNLLCRNTAGAAVNIGPDLGTGATFKIYGPLTTSGDGSALMLEWQNVLVTNASENDTLWVRVVVELTNTTDDELRFWTWVGRQTGRSSAVEEVGSPFVVLKGFSTERGAESEIEGQVRCRAIVPHSANVLLPGVPTHNVDVRYLSQLNVIGGTVSHPATGAHLPLVAFCDADDQAIPASDYLRTLCLWAEDTETWAKKVRLTGAGQFSSSAWVRAEIVQIPSFVNDHAGVLAADGFPPHSRQGNSFGPRYPVVVSMFRSLTSDWWYDVCERYREWYRGVHSPLKTRDNPQKGGLTKGRSLFFPHIQNDFVNPDFLPDVEALASILSAELPGAETKVSHFQSWTAKSLGVGNPSPSLDAIPGLEETIATLRAAGWKVSLYTNPLHIAIDWIPSKLDQGMYARISSGTLVGTIDDEEEILLRALRETSLAIVDRYDLQAIYLDTYTGSSLLLYGREAGRRRRDHGDKTPFEARLAGLAFARERGRAISGDPDFQISTENAQEGIFDMDWTQDGYGFEPFHLLLADETADHAVLRPSPPAMSDHPPQARMMSIPFWQCVHHEWCPASRLSAGFSTRHLFRNTDFYPGDLPNTPDHGLGDDEWVDFLCGQVAYSWIGGAPVFTISVGWDRFDPIVNAAGLASAFDVNDRGLDVRDFYLEMWNWLQVSKAGEFLLWGKMLRPLQCDYLSAAYDTELSPASHALNLLDYATDGGAGWFSYSSIADVEYRWGNRAFDVPRVLQTVWEGDGGVIGLVLCNWSRTAAKFFLTFDPTLYGLVTFDVDQRQLGGAPINLDSGASGTVTIGDALADYNLGTLGAHTCTVVTFTPV